jgi:hypothetical protein
MSSAADILKAAAAETDLEASNSSFTGLLEAAADVAETTGLASPLPNKGGHSQTENSPMVVDRSANGTPMHHTHSEGMKPQGSASPKRPASVSSTGKGHHGHGHGKTVTISSPSDDLARQMAAQTISGPPGGSDTRGLGSTAASGFRASKPASTYGRAGRKSGFNSTNKSTDSTMRRSYGDGDGDPFGGPRSQSQGAGSQARRSDLADFLHKSTDKPWEDRIASSFSSYSQEVLFRSMMQPVPLDSKAQGKGKSGQKKKDTKPHASDKDKDSKKKSARKNEMSKVFASLDDAKECTFKPVICGNPNNEGGDGEVKGASFLDRMEMKENERKTTQNTAVGEMEYDAILDKKFCPNCTAKQSYDEIKEKRKRCPNCNIEYRTKVAWGQVSAQFFGKQKLEAEKKTKAALKVQKEMEVEDLKKRYSRFDRKAGKVVVDEAAIEKALAGPEAWNEDMEETFFGRMDEMMAKKLSGLKDLDAKIMEEQYPFKPTITKRHGDDEDEDEDGGTGFMRRLEDDLDKRRAAAAKAAKRNKKEEVQPPLGKPWKPR